MAKDSFFIRASVGGLTAGAFGQTPIDLGSYVDALGSSILRIHNISVRYNFAGNTSPEIALGGPGTDGRGFFQLTTQSQGALVSATNRAVISTGMITAANDTAAANAYSFVTDRLDLAPQNWTNGYLVAVEQIYLGGQATGFTNALDIEIVMECTVEKMTSSAAMALALSQQ